MRVTADTNVLVRAVVGDDKRQAHAAATLLKQAELIAVPLPTLCEFVWILRKVYQFGQESIAAAIEALLEADNVVVNRPAVEIGLLVFKAGGDFADGVIAYEGSWAGGDTFVSFDKQAVALISQQGKQARLLK